MGDTKWGKLGEYGVVYNYEFPFNKDSTASLVIQEIENLRWFHRASL